MDKIIFRKATIQDAAAVSALTDAAYTKYIPIIGHKPQPMTADYAKMVVEGSIWLLTLEERPVGVLVLVDEPDDLLIYSVAVHPDYQKQGLGRRLLAWAEQQALQAGYRSIRLYTNERMVENIRLYKSLGYQETSREQRPGTAIVHMSKQLEK
jgi:ribosomal protein S18 acetylase RimI-like enzyme